MDLDADGNADVVSGSYWPGHLYWFRGLGGGRFAKGAALLGKDGQRLLVGKAWKDEDEPDLNCLATAPCLFDWDRDGDLDLLVGNIRGKVVLIRNEGTARKAAWGSEREFLKAAGRPVAVDGDAGPCVADWDGDGRADLLVGGENGAVFWFRNTAAEGEPVFEAARTLIEAAPGLFENRIAEGQLPLRPGMRAKLCVGDWDGDGVRDLLVGDYGLLWPAAKELGFLERTKLKILEKRRDQLLTRLAEVEMDERAGVEEKEARALAIQEKLAAVQEQIEPLDSMPVPHGWVWLYRGRAPR